jgi:hypothetical protein
MSADPQEQVQQQDHAHPRQDTPQNERDEVASRDGTFTVSSGSTDGSKGGQPFFVAPASYLKPLGRPQGAGAKAGAPGHGEMDVGVGVKGGRDEKRGSLVEREQIDGLVSETCITSGIRENAVETRRRAYMTVISVPFADKHIMNSVQYEPSSKQELATMCSH